MSYQILEHQIPILEENITPFIADEEIEELLIAIESASVRKKIADEEEKELKKELEELIKDSQEIVDKTGYVLATWKFTQTNRFNTAKFENDHPDLYMNYLTQSTSRRLLRKARPVK